MAIVFEMIPQAGGDGVLLCQVPNTAAGDFDVVRPTIVSVEQDGVLTDIPVNVPALEWAASECPVLVTGVDDKVTNAQVSFDASLGIFEFTASATINSNTKTIVLSDSTSTIVDNMLSLRVEPTSDPLVNVVNFVVKSNGTTKNLYYSVDVSLQNTYQLIFGEGKLDVKINGIKVSVLAFDDPTLLNVVQLASASDGYRKWEGRTKSILIHDSHDTKDKYLFKTFDEMANFANYKIIQ